ncbi:MAG: tRNA(fMet)-specific endonuclease VapC [Bradyrhizobium sp.]|nr:tRNA(fMet)-specific endonuclease VapC [Bradyrhizobium sp.]
MIYLDTNVAIALLNDVQPRVRARFDAAQAAGTPFSLSMIVYYELMYGAAASQRRKANEDKIALFIASGGIALRAFEAADAVEAAEIRAQLKRTAKPIGPYDVLIAAQARRAGTTLVTANTREFERVPGLIVVDWAA